MKTVKENTLTAEQIVEHAQKNHIWVNAMNCVRPSPKFLQEIGASVLDQLNSSEIRGELSDFFPVVYIRVNKS